MIQEQSEILDYDILKHLVLKTFWIQGRNSLSYQGLATIREH